MLEEFHQLTRAISQTWPPKTPTYVLRPEYASFTYTNQVSEKHAIDVHRCTTRVKRIIVRITNVPQLIEDPYPVVIWLEPGYVVLKDRKVIHQDQGLDGIIRYIVEGLKMRLDRLEK